MWSTISTESTWTYYYGLGGYGPTSDKYVDVPKIFLFKVYVHRAVSSENNQRRQSSGFLLQPPLFVNFCMVGFCNFA